MTLGAPVPALRLETWKLVGWKCFRALIPATARELGERGGESVHGILGQLRIGDVTLNAMHREASAQRAAPTDLDRVPDGSLAGGLPDDTPVDALTALAQGFHHPFRAINRGPLLIARDEEGDRALVPRMRLDEGLGGRHHGGQPALHVGRAPPVKDPIADDGRERIAAPLLQRAGRHHVRVPREAKHRTGLTATRPEILDVAIPQRLYGKARRAQAPGHDLLAALIRGGY